MMPDLLSCPFCGSVRTNMRSSGEVRKEHWWVCCRECDSDGPYKTTEEEARDAWNTRYKFSDEKIRALEDQQETLHTGMIWIMNKATDRGETWLVDLISLVIEKAGLKREA